MCKPDSPFSAQLEYVWVPIFLQVLTRLVTNLGTYYWASYLVMFSCTVRSLWLKVSFFSWRKEDKICWLNFFLWKFAVMFGRLSIEIGARSRKNVINVNINNNAFHLACFSTVTSFDLSHGVVYKGKQMKINKRLVYAVSWQIYRQSPILS